MRFYQVPAIRASQQTPSYQNVWVSKSVPGVCLAMERATPSWTGDGTIEFVERQCFTTEHILESLYRTSGYLGV